MATKRVKYTTTCQLPAYDPYFLIQAAQVQNSGEYERAVEPAVRQAITAEATRIKSLIEQKASAVRP